MDHRAIGIFDSGHGGLSVWREIRKTMPCESLIYFGDGENCPYGSRSREEIRGYTLDAAEWLAGQGAKLIVIACNTATSASITDLREKYPQIPFVGMEPAIKPAAETTKTGKVAVVATEASLNGELFKATAEKYGRGVEIFSAPGHGFVEIVEEGSEGTPEALETVRLVLEPLLQEGIDKLVLGCSHYPFLLGEISRVIGDRDIEIVHSAPAIARRVGSLLDEKGLRAGPDNEPQYIFHSLAGEVYIRKLSDKACSNPGMEL